MITLIAASVLGSAEFGPLPSPRQLAWQAMDFNAFVHFGPNTFTGKEWGEGKERPDEFAPSELDCRQWARTFKLAGMKGVVITAKHHDGFCLWPSKFSTHTVRESKWKGGKGDVLRELSDACRAEGLKFGVYLSPWDRNHPKYGTDDYNTVFVNMLKEVLTQYGETFEVWFDGANGEGPNGRKQVYDWPRFHAAVRKYAPKAVIFSDAGPDIRWVGNENGFASETSWSMLPSGRYVPGTPYYKELGEGSATGDLWVAPECDVSIRPGWFWRESEDQKVKTPDELFAIWLGSVGRNGSLLLNVPPDSRGLIHESDVRALMGFKRLRDRELGKKLAEGVSSLKLAKPSRVKYIELREEIRSGQRVSKFVVDSKSGSGWKEVASGTTIGNRRILQVSLEDATELRVRVLSSRAEPKLLSFIAY